MNTYKSGTMKTRAQILVVDDNAVMLKFLTSLLADKYEVVSKLSAFEAFRWLEEGNYPALIISDLMSPGMDNFTFVKNLKISGFYRNTPVVMLSTILQSRQPWDLAPMVDAYFTKPFNPIKLKDTITHLLTEKYNATAA